MSPAFSIKNPEADKLARRVAQLTGESLTDAVKESLQQRLERIEVSRGKPSMAARLDAIALECAALPVLDDRPMDELLGYDENGLPT